MHEWKERGEWPPKSDAELAVHTSAGTGTGSRTGMGKRAVVVGAGKKGDGFAKMAVGTTVRKVLRLGEGKGGGG